MSRQNSARKICLPCFKDGGIRFKSQIKSNEEANERFGFKERVFIV